MRSASVVLILSLCVAPAVAAQQGASPPDIEPLSSLRTPTSPAFTLLGIEPTSVERPSSPADFAATILSQTNGLATLPQNFAIEASPYWLSSHPLLTWQMDAQRSLWESIQRTTTVSFATAPIPKTTDMTGLGIGIRSSLVSGHLSQDTRNALGKRAGALAKDGATFLALMYRNGLADLDRELSRCATLPPEQQQPCVDALKYDDKKQAIANAVLASDEFKKAATKATALAISREGFSVDVAAAWTWKYTGNNSDTRQFSKGGFWFTPAYQSGHWVAVGVLRYVRDALNTTQMNSAEGGGRGIYSTDENAFSLEYVVRSFPNSSVDGSYRLVVVAEHKIGDVLWLTASFGHDRTRTDSPGSLLAQLGISLNLSKERFKFN